MKLADSYQRVDLDRSSVCSDLEQNEASTDQQCDFSPMLDSNACSTYTQQLKDSRFIDSKCYHFDQFAHCLVEEMRQSTEANAKCSYSGAVHAASTHLRNLIDSEMCHCNFSF